ncbi:Acetyltransferase (GNAT) family protein [Albimonas donghaensis]|uniref:Acetyltransferase (GNAT) family protein n=1 Tax=Albimonas donghaensis TaxID=356660 RepID=A0A1H2RDL1_9RHOB|nr:GNAT family N-acetyltransferase [Albimonas donghaensis]SDW17240.1 Acetyltransferase (GNAT) family protein [Albimonas donghaensis]
MPPGYALRDAGPADGAAVFALFAALQDFERAREPDRRPGADCAGHVAWLTDWAAEGGCVLLAEDAAGAAHGLLIAGLQDEGAYVPEATRIRGHVSDLYVAPEARRKGLALALLREAEARMAARGVRKLTIDALAWNAPALALYRAWAGPETTIGFERDLPVAAAVDFPPSR